LAETHSTILVDAENKWQGLDKRKFRNL